MRLGYTAIECFMFIDMYQSIRLQALDEKHIERAWRDTGLAPLQSRRL